MTQEITKTAMPLWRKDGTGQTDRLLAKRLPAPDTLQVDPLDLLGHLGEMAEAAKELAFVSASNRVEGSWYGLFTSDESCLLAVIAGEDLSGCERRVRSLGRRCNGLRALRLLAEAYKVALALNRWYGLLLACSGQESRSLLAILSGVIEKDLSEALARIELAEIRICHDLGRKKSLVRPEQFYPIWNVKEAALARLQKGGRETALSPHLFYRFYNAAEQIKEAARSCFEASLFTKNHDAAAGLILTFLSLYKEAAKAMNAFPERHRDLYYNKVLGFKHREGKPGCLYLAFSSRRSKENAFQVWVPKGTQFEGGKKTLGDNLASELLDEVTVQKGEITRVQTLFCERDPLISPEHELGLVSALRHHGVGLVSAKTLAEKGISHQERFSLLGAGIKGEDARIGFALAASVLELAEGARTIEMTLVSSPLSQEQLGLFEKTLDSLCQSRKEGRKGALRILFSQGFQIRLSIASGWEEVHDWSLSANVSKEGLSLGFQIQLERSFPSVVACTQEVHGKGQIGRCGLPCIEVLLNPRAPVYLYSLLSQVTLTEALFSVSVSGAERFALKNQLGPLDPQTPFAPFGPIPRCGSFLTVHHPESAPKEVTHLSLHLRWADLPQIPGGFYEHYRVYDRGIDTGSFAVRLSALKRGRWLFEAGSSLQKLFTEKRDSARLPQNHSTLSLDDPRLLSAEPLSKQKHDGALKVELVSPDMAFGHELYPELLTRQLMLQAKIKKGIELPKAPYTPMIQHMAIDYAARQKVCIHGGQGDAAFFHIYPLGTQRGRGCLVPHFESDAQLMIGITAEKVAGRVNLLFCLSDDATALSGQAPLKLLWGYLKGESWCTLEERAVLYDGTKGFLTSGIVVLDLPELKSEAHGVMPDDLIWLRAQVAVEKSEQERLQKRLKGLASCRALVLNGARAKLLSSDGEMSPHGSVHRPSVDVPGLGAAHQVLDGFGRRASEKGALAVARFQERLRHKKRAVTPWDVERLLLAEVPDLQKVKCFSAMDEKGACAPGHFLVAVLPKEKDEEEAPPRFAAHELSEMEAFLREHMSPHARVCVTNPVYEKIQVRCTLTLKKAQGNVLQRVHGSIGDFLSPWVEEVGYRPRFGWCIRQSEVLAFLSGHPDVISVTNFSMLHITRSPQGIFAMGDTVIKSFASEDDENENLSPCRGTQGPPQSLTRKEIRPTTPWSMAIPAGAHFLETHETAEPIAPEKTGVGELEVGRTFIILR